MIRGVYYPSQTAAARALGVNTCVVTKALERGTINNVGRGKTGRPGMPVTIRGVTYGSLTDAARAIGVSVTAIIEAKQRNGLDRVGLRKHRHD